MAPNSRGDAWRKRSSNEVNISSNSFSFVSICASCVQHVWQPAAKKPFLCGNARRSPGLYGRRLHPQTCAVRRTVVAERMASTVSSRFRTLDLSSAGTPKPVCSAVGHSTKARLLSHRNQIEFLRHTRATGKCVHLATYRCINLAELRAPAVDSSLVSLVCISLPSLRDLASISPSR